MATEFSRLGFIIAERGMGRSERNWEEEEEEEEEEE